MPSDQTRGAILAAAERLYADRGFGDVTLRDIVAAANVNLAAVNYHFGSKDELIAELFVTRSLALNRERLRQLKAAEDRGGGVADIAAILRVRNREIDHLRKFIAVMRRSLPERSDVELYWGLHFALAMAQQTVRDSERLTKLSEGKCDVDDVDGVITRVVDVAVMALTGFGPASAKTAPRAAAPVKV